MSVPNAKNVAVARLPSAQVTAPLLGAGEAIWAETKHLLLSPNFQVMGQSYYFIFFSMFGSFMFETWDCLLIFLTMAIVSEDIPFSVFPSTYTAVDFPT